LENTYYNVVAHEDGWAYKANGTFSESYSTREAALAAAKRAALEQQQPEQNVKISFEDEQG
jgi:hypothetical protein